ncbi:hypothetical protein [Priestia megaterium]|uniref:hypothetical protein n=1 Tax=Priestia megaterium TaxID=1404 RepID=UPI002E1DD545|nr:hypothetical protein [Priestia megaterium]
MKLMLDKVEYKNKPQGAEVGMLSKRIIHSPIDISVEELAENISKGKTFIPAYFKEGKTIRRTKDYWYSQQVIALDFDEGMTLEEAIEEFSNTAVFIYPTFSHSQKQDKFRVVFILDKILHELQEFDEIISNLMNKYPNADKQCKDCTRLFYGGKEVIKLNYDNRLNVNDFLKKSPKDFGRTYKNNLVIYPAKNLQQQYNNAYENNSNIAQNIDLIKKKNISELQKRIKSKPKVVHNDYELFDYLKKQDLRLYLGINTNKNFLDVFHEEENPSASIYSSHKGNEHQLYKCFSTSHPFVGTILQVTERLLNCSILEVKKFLIELYQVEIKESKQQKELKVVIDIYKELLQSDDLEELYPNFYKVFSKYGYLQDMYILLDLVKEYLPSGDDPRLLFHHSIDTIAKKIRRSRSVTHTRINFLTFFKLITKLGKDEIPTELYDSQLKSRREKGYRYLNSTYELNIYSYDFFNELDVMCAIWVEKGCTTKTVNYEGILRNFGRVEADRVFPQDKGREIPPINEGVAFMIRKATLELIEGKGWTSEQEVLGNVTLYFRGQKKFKEKQFKICLGEILEDYDLERIRLNKELKEQMGIEGNGYGFIIKNKEYIRDVSA